MDKRKINIPSALNYLKRSDDEYIYVISEIMIILSTPMKITKQPVLHPKKGTIFVYVLDSI
jgi:hypothetical protein